MMIRARGSPYQTWLINLILGLIMNSSALAELDWIRVTTEYTPPKTDGHQIVFDIAESLIVMFGGVQVKDRAQPVYIYDGFNWLRVPSSGDWPAWRSHFGMAYDTSRNVVVMFGGFQGGFDYLGDTWEWDGAQWEQKFPEHSPEDRYGHSMAYIDTLESVCLFGGVMESTDPSNELWIWDGVDWTDVTPATGPSPRAGTPIVYDNERDRLVLFGGTEDGNSEFDDTWEWDGLFWEEIITEHSPVGKRSHMMVFDSWRHVIVLFGNALYYPGGTSQETWEYDGSDWNQVFPVHLPTERCALAGCFDVVRGRTVIYGGYTWTGSSNETWEYYDVPTPTPSTTPTQTPTLTPKPTATPLVTGVTIAMPSHLFHTGDSCFCTVAVTNGGPEPLINHPLFVILDVYGSYFFAPSFTQTPENYPGPWSAGNTTVDVIQSFLWPDTGTSASGLVFYAALTDPEVTKIVGEWDSFEFGWEDGR